MGAYDIVNIVPVKLVEFKARKYHHGVVLKWTTASEFNNKGFFIERAETEEGFTEIGFVNGRGTWNGTLNYTFVDQQINNYTPVIFYRLKQIDYDGEFVYSKVVSVNNKTKLLSDVSVYPNPTQGSVSVSIINQQNDNAFIQVYGLNGELIVSKNHQLVAGENSIVIDEINEQKNGVYVLKIQTSTNKLIHKIIKH
jgi:hypothetical protein